MSDSATAPTMPTADELAARLNAAMLGTYDFVSVYLGDRLGYYQALHDDGPCTAAELAARARCDERYTREWLEQQAVTGFLACDNPGAKPADRRFRLPADYAPMFLDPDCLTPMAAYARAAVATFAPLPELLAAFRTGAGVPYEHYGDDLIEGQAATTRPLFTNLLTTEWIPAIPDLHARLLADPPARIADIGMGFGWSSIELARGYPKVRVDGFDLDHASVNAARANAATAGLSDRVTFHVRDAGDADLAGAYDLAFAFECIHDMANPIATLSAMRRLVGPGGTVLIADENAAETFQPFGSESERLLYGFSIFHCLPVGRVDQPSAETGAVMRPEILRGYAIAAGFAAVEILPIEHPGFRFYRLIP